MVARTTETLGGPDILVNNAGIQHVAPIEDFPPERWEAVIAMNLSGGLQRDAGGDPADARAGLGTDHQYRLGPRAGRECGEGGRCRGQARRAGADQGGRDRAGRIRGSPANAICPGWVLTPMVERQLAARAERDGTSLDEAKRRLLAEKQPMGRFTTPEQIGALAVFLCSEAAATITGAPLPIDGGWVAQ